MTSLRVDDPDFRLYVGDVRVALAALPDESVDCCVTSPPYWSLRDYGTDGQIGLEATWEEYVETLVGVFAHVRRVLAPHGTLWLNLGDCYSSGSSGERIAGVNQRTLGRPGHVATQGTADRRRGRSEGLRPKNLIGLPWRVAFALQADGWILRCDNIWSKPNPMPESVTDRATRAHEYVFHFALNDRYYHDAAAVREPFVTVPQQRLTATAEQPGAAARAAQGGQNPAVQGGPNTLAPPQEETLGGMDGETPRGPDGRRKRSVSVGDGSHGNYDSRDGGERWPNSGRNMRSVWTIPTHSYPDAHFAVFPEELPRRCIKAGVPERVCRTCGKPSARIEEKGTPEFGSTAKWDADGPTGKHGHAQGGGSTPDVRMGPMPQTATVGWTDCGHGDWRAGVVLDPFMGSGTVARVARSLNRHCVGIELNPEYADLIAKSTDQLSLLA